MPAPGPPPNGARTDGDAGPARKAGAGAGAVEVVVVRQEPSAPGGETTAVRLLGLLPADWICVPDDVGTDRVRLRIEYGHGGHGVGDSDGVHGALAEVLADTALRGWSAEPS